MDLRYINSDQKWAKVKMGERGLLKYSTAFRLTAVMLLNVETSDILSSYFPVD